MGISMFSFIITVIMKQKELIIIDGNRNDFYKMKSIIRVFFSIFFSFQFIVVITNEINVDVYKRQIISFVRSFRT